MQPSTPNDVYRPHITNQPGERDAFDVIQEARQREVRIGAAKAALDQIYASAETPAEEVRADAHDVSAESKEINMPEVFSEIHGIGISLENEREEVIRNGWPV